MGQEKDKTLKFITEEQLEIIISLLPYDLEIDLDEVEILSEELTVVDAYQVRPDITVKTDNLIIMIEFESSKVDIKNAKRFKLYVTSYDYKKNDENKPIYFGVISTAEDSKWMDYSLNNWDRFKFPIVSLRDLDLEKILNRTKSKLKNNEEFTNRELVELALTPIMHETREEVINQFYETFDLMSMVDFPTSEVNNSTFAVSLLLSNMYFHKNDSVRKQIQGIYLMHIDCIEEKFQENYDNGYDSGYDSGYGSGINDGIQKTIKETVVEMLKNDYSLSEIQKITKQSEEDILEIKKDLSF